MINLPSTISYVKRDGGWVKFEFNWYLKAVTVVESRITIGRSFHSRIASVTMRAA